MDAAHKLRIKIGSAEFEAEGSQETVQQQYADFLKAITVQPQVRGTAQHNLTRQQDPPVDGEQPQPPSIHSNVDDSIMARVFARDRRSGLSLSVLPRTANKVADSLVLLLYGYAVLLGQNDVTGMSLMASAQQSGVPTPRVDKVLLSADYRELVTKAGFKRGSKYGLNNRGMARAEEMLSTILS